MKTPILVIATQKGGCAKTTTASALLDGLELLGKNCVGVDLDAQGDLELIRPEQENVAFAYDLIANNAVSDSKLFCADDRLVGVAKDVSRNKVVRESLLFGLEKVKADLIIIDTPPKQDAINVLALYAATHVIIPVTPDAASIAGVARELEFITQISEDKRSPMPEVGILIVKTDLRTNIDKLLIEQMREQFESMDLKCFESAIPQRVAIRQSQLARKPLITSHVLKRGAVMQYANFCDEVFKWIF